MSQEIRVSLIDMIRYIFRYVSFSHMNVYTIEYPRPLSNYHGLSLGLLRDQGLQRGLDKDFHRVVPRIRWRTGELKAKEAVYKSLPNTRVFRGSLTIDSMHNGPHVQACTDGVYRSQQIGCIKFQINFHIQHPQYLCWDCWDSASWVKFPVIIYLQEKVPKG
jgi:hypothetical protein